MVVIGLIGISRSGKDTIAEYLKKFGFNKVIQASLLNECMEPIVKRFNLDTEDRLSTLNPLRMSYRHIREVIGKSFYEEGISLAYTQSVLDAYKAAIPNAAIIVSDVRRVEEIEMLHERYDAKFIHVFRVVEDHLLRQAESHIPQMVSDMRDKGIPILRVLNTSTKEDLYKNVNKALAYYFNLPYIPDISEYGVCQHKHKLQGTASFFYSEGYLKCNECGGYQKIRKPV